MRIVLLSLLVGAAVALQPHMPADVASNEVLQRQMAGDSLLSDIMNQCFHSLNLESMTCMRVRVLMYMNQLLGSNQGRQPQFHPHMLERKDNGPIPDAVPRDEDSMTSDDKIDEMIASRVARYARSHVFQMQLPETLFQSAKLTFNPNTFDVDYSFPAPTARMSRGMAEARGILKKKLLLPVLLLLKLKMKALMPILVLVSSIKAVKALVISKIALLVVAGFVFLQLCKKLGGGAAMMPGMMMPAAPEMTPAPPSAGYGAPPMPYSAPSAPQNSYGPAENTWEPSAAASSNSYSRVYDAHQLAYKSYYNPQGDATVQPQQTASSSSSSAPQQ
ncbi:uncharacterized protein LOC132204570 [Neocloeon triangulifer]|uniref:uncharacterized protein LOC132204570 n=1 Tax=Neocloeon triangulifer TaxID=2078957 RepID=UPI00286F4ED4|nr:uncharacterized protein LOC132204570 [Neocloeon triangulifer]